jgi:molecular chaperone Hsp33
MLGQALCAAALLTSNTKFDGAIALQIQTTGALRLLHGQCTHDGRLRGIARTRGALTPERWGQALLAINLEPSSGASPYQGIVSMDPSGLVPALETYFQQSEQLDTRFWLLAGTESCHGLMLQRVPGDVVDPEAWRRAVQRAGSATPEALARLETEQLLRHLFRSEPLRLFAASAVRFACRCSVRRVAEVLHSLGEEEIMGLIEERGVVEVSCEYCGMDYRFDRVDAAGLFSGGPFNRSNPTEVH